MVVHSVDGGHCPRICPPLQHNVEPPPTRTGSLTLVPSSAWAVLASILVLLARLSSSYAEVWTPLTVVLGPAWLRQVLLTGQVPQSCTQLAQVSLPLHAPSPQTGHTPQSVAHVAHVSVALHAPSPQLGHD